MKPNKTIRNCVIAFSLIGLAAAAPLTYAVEGTSSPTKTVHKSSKKSTSKKKHPKKICSDCGTIQDIREIEQEGEGSGLGAIAGGVAGALLGHQVGGGTGKDVATIAGAAGGAYAGHIIEKKVKKTKHYEITVNMEDGKSQVITLQEAPVFAVGSKVKIVDGKLERN